MQFGSTFILRATIYAIGLAVLALCLFGLPRLIAAEFRGDFDYGWIFLGMYITAVPFFFALWHGLRLLDFIDHTQAFTALSVRAFRNIKYSAYVISGLYAAGMPYIFYVADRDDAPGVAAIGFVIIFASFVIATAAGVFQQLVQHAVDIKTENDLTV